MKFLLFMIIIFMTGCSNPFHKPVIVEVPITSPCPKPVIVEKPNMPIYNLKIGDNPDITARAYVNSILLLKEYTEKLEKSLEPYKDGN